MIQHLLIVRLFSFLLNQFDWLFVLAFVWLSGLTIRLPTPVLTVAR